MIIDRFEGDYAVMETDEGMVNIHRLNLPSTAREGDVINYNNGVYSVDRNVSDKLRSEVSEKIKKLLNANYD